MKQKNEMGEIKEYKNLFENIPNILATKLNYLSTQIQHCKTEILNTNKLNIIENESISVQLKKQETYFDKLFQLYLLSNDIVNCEKEIDQFMIFLKDKIYNFFSEFKEKRDEYVIEINNLMAKMKQNESKMKQNIFTEDYEKMNYQQIVENVKTMKNGVKQENKIEEENMKIDEYERKFSDKKEKKRWKK